MAIKSLLLGMAAGVGLVTAAVHAQRLTLSADTDWRFHLGDAAGAQEPSFDDAAWAPVEVPHDWSIAGPFSPDNPTGAAGGYLPAGVGWYRRTFTLPAGAQSVWRIAFDGVMAHSDVWLNGIHLGARPSGAVSFSYDLTFALNAGGKPNLLAVRVDNSREPAARWYTGAGIYRHVRLIGFAGTHLDPASIYVTTPEAKAEHATVRIAGTVVNDAPERVTVTPDAAVGSAHAKAAPLTLAPGASASFVLALPLEHPERWSPDHPALQEAIVRLRAAGRTLDSQSVSFGVREIDFDPATGFWINGRNLKLKGVCLHDDVSALGAAAPLAAWSRRLRALQSLGANAIRTAHNPPDPGFLDLCDRLGFLVMDEFFDAWTVGKEPYDYHRDFAEWSERDARDTLRRDRNHPSVILWSVGNEIHDTPQAAKAKAILARLVAACRAIDPSRPVTQALFRPNVSHDYDNGLADLLDVVGTNYRYNELLAAHAAKPTRSIVGTENRRSREEWLAVRDNAPYSGEFIWTGVDYLGEAGRWPTVAAGSGLIDRTGMPRPVGYEVASWWSERPMVKAVRRIAPPPRPSNVDPGYGAGPIDANLRFPQVLFADWTPASLSPHEETVEVYSNAPVVELWLNHHPVGEPLRLPADLKPRVWRVPFAAGTLEAVARDDGRGEVARDVLRTAGAPARVELRAEPLQAVSAGEQVAYLCATVVDRAGVPVPTAAPEIAFAIAGPARIVAVDSADNRSHEPFQAVRRHAFQGRAWVLVRPVPAGAGAENAVVTAMAPDLASGSASVAFPPSELPAIASAASSP